MVKLYSIYKSKGSNLSHQSNGWFINLLSIFSGNKKKTLYDNQTFKPNLKNFRAATGSKANLIRKQK